MRKFLLAALATAVLAPASLLAGSASAQVAPLAKFQQLLNQDRIATVYDARGGGRGFRGGGGYRGAAFRRPAGGMHRVAYRGGYRGNIARAGVYRGNVARVGAYRNVARYPYGGRYYRTAYGRPYYRGAYYRPYYGRYGYYRPYYGYGAAAATGALIGGAIASQPVVTGSVGTSGSAYCAQRFRSYNPATGTYTGYDGRQHPCP